MKLVVWIVLAVVAVLVVGGALFLYQPDESRAALDAKYGVTPADYAEVAGIRLHLLDTGPRTAPAIVLLHGFGSSLLTWTAWADALSKDYRVVRYDLPGFGLTGPDPTGDYSEPRGEAVLAALMDHLGIARATVVGNSMGGKLAWNFAADHPDRVERLVLVSPDGFASKGFEYGRKPNIPPMLRLLPFVLPTAMLRATLAPAYGNPAALTAPIFARYRDMMLAPGVRGAIVERMRQVELRDPVPPLRTIQAPTLILWGERDKLIPFTNAADYMAALPHATLVPFPDLGHVPFEEAPAESLAPLRAFLSDKS